ncbi:MAG: hypothetical protein JXO22_00540, partial [Phycisphaerae bacterium]|nr:hypothetical protein [Phycisphaerae bacterium]
MGRGIVLAVSTACMLVLVFLAYTFLVQDPSATEREETAAGAGLPERPEASPEETLHVGQIPLQPGKSVDYTIYDDKTGRLRQRVRFADWRKVAGSEDEIAVTGPQMMVVLPGRQIATISADKGQIAVDSIRQSDMQPRSGSLSGNACIVIDRATGPDRTPLAERLEDAVTIRMDTLDFDLINGLLRTDGPVNVTLADAELSGVGLNLVWNDSDNRLEELRLMQGGRIVLHRGGELLGGFMGGGDAEPNAPADAADAATRPDAAIEARTAYVCRIDGNIVAQQLRGEMVVGGLDAEFVEMVFDVGGGRRWADTQRQPTSAPATQPATQPAEEEPVPGQLVVTWSGELKISPQVLSERYGERRRWFVAG